MGKREQNLQKQPEKMEEKTTKEMTKNSLK